jgi:hypothetical protein
MPKAQSISLPPLSFHESIEALVAVDPDRVGLLKAANQSLTLKYARLLNNHQSRADNYAKENERAHPKMPYSAFEVAILETLSTLIKDQEATHNEDKAADAR